MVNLMKLSGSFEDIKGSNPEARRSYGSYVPKDWFISDGVGGLEGFGKQCGNIIAESENAMLLKVIIKARPLRRRSGNINERLNEAIANMAERGYRPNVAFLPWYAWLMTSELQLEPLASDQGSLVARGETLGLFQGLRVIETRDVPEDRVILADLCALGTFRQWDRAGVPLEISLTQFDEEAAREKARAEKGLMRVPGRTLLADRAYELRKHILVDVSAESAFELKAPNAARAVYLPPGLKAPKSRASTAVASWVLTW